MSLRMVRTSLLILAGFTLIVMSAKGVASTTLPPLPNPVLNFLGQEFVTIRGKDFTRYNYQVENLADYPKALFAAAPQLPPCGANTNASRTWVDIYDQRGVRLNGFCALGGPNDLSSIWFALERDVLPPSYVYIEMTDRQTNTKYKSNLADTTM